MNARLPQQPAGRPAGQQPAGRYPSAGAPAARPDLRLPAPRGTGQGPERDTLLAPGEVAALFGVDAKTVSRWAKTGRLTCIRTLGGHRRFSRSEVDRLLARVDPGR